MIKFGDKIFLIIDYKSVKNVLELVMNTCIVKLMYTNWLCFYLAFIA